MPNSGDCFEDPGVTRGLVSILVFVVEMRRKHEGPKSDEDRGWQGFHSYGC